MKKMGRPKSDNPKSACFAVSVDIALNNELCYNIPEK